MAGKYHIEARQADNRFQPVFRLSSIETAECLGCLDCAKRKCIYDVYAKRRFLPGELTDSAGSYCKSCMRCVQECRNRILAKVLNPAYAALGNAHWTPAIIASLWQQALTGKIPVSGAGYDGPFTGEGFDDMWTDMSEIVRPTRDGIHGREYISTSVDIGRKKSRMDPSEKNPAFPPLFTLPFPVVLSVPDRAAPWQAVRQAVTEAAERTGVLALGRGAGGPALMPCFRPGEKIDPDPSCRIIEITLDSHDITALEQAADQASAVSARRPDLVTCIGLPAGPKAAECVLHLAKLGVPVVRLFADMNGRENGKGAFIKERVREAHKALVAESIRDCVTLLAGGGIAMAEHVAKLIACGADAVVADDALLVALECRMCMDCAGRRPCAPEVEKIDPAWGAQRIVNLLASWHSQLIEVLGAMGLREVRRLRGETGRVMFFEDLEKECFAPIFGKRTCPQS